MFYRYDECAATPCDAIAACVNTDGSFTCTLLYFARLHCNLIGVASLLYFVQLHCNLIGVTSRLYFSGLHCNLIGVTSLLYFLGLHCNLIGVTSLYILCDCIAISWLSRGVPIMDKKNTGFQISIMVAS